MGLLSYLSRIVAAVLTVRSVIRSTPVIYNVIPPKIMLFVLKMDLLQLDVSR